MNQEQRLELMQRYVAMKTMNGASASEIADGVINPVAQLRSVTSSTPPRANKVGAGPKPWVVIAGVGVMACALVLWVVLSCLVALCSL